MKRERYLELVSKRKSCRECAGLRNPGDEDLCEFDSDEIGPWARLQGDLAASLMVVGQDWGDVSYYRNHKGIDDPRNPTTRMLEELLQNVGIKADLRPNSEPCGVFLTNAILCLKDGGLQARVEAQWFSECGKRFLRAQIELVSPRVVVALGHRAHKAVLQAFGLRAPKLRTAVESMGGTRLSNGSNVLAVYHCGRRVLNKDRSREEQHKDWERVSRALASAESKELRCRAT